MISNTKLHRLLSQVSSWQGDLRYDVEDYLEAHCSTREIVRLYELTEQQHVIPHSDRFDKVELITDLLPRIKPGELLAAWEVLLQERTGRKEQRRADLDALDKPHTDDALADVLRVLSPYEIAVLYYGQDRLLHDLQEAHIARITNGRKPVPGVRSSVELAHLSRLHLDGGLDWLAHDDPKKAEAVAAHLAQFPDERAVQGAASIRRVLVRATDQLTKEA